MHEMQTILIPMCAVSVSLSVTRLKSASLCGGHSVQPLPNHFGLLLLHLQLIEYLLSFVFSDL